MNEGRNNSAPPTPYPACPQITAPCVLLSCESASGSIESLCLATVCTQASRSLCPVEYTKSSSWGRSATVRHYQYSLTIARYRVRTVLASFVSYQILAKIAVDALQSQR